MNRKGPLAGVKVLDFTHVLSGSYGTMLLGDLGADILKVERKGEGDALRNTPPLKNGQSAYFFCTNRNKRCLSLDLKKEGAIELVNRLVKGCDVFAENFRPGVMDRLGLGYEDIQKARPDIIYASLSAFGEKGPYKDRPGFELIIQSLVGLVDVTSEAGERPAKVQPQIADICGGLYMAVAILGALHHRNQTGQGQRITTSLTEGLFALMTNFVYLHLLGSEIPNNLGTRNPMLFPSQSFKTKDGYLSTVVVPAHWERFCRALDKPEWIEHPDYGNVVFRVEQYDAMEAMVEEVMTTKTTADWVEIFGRHQVAAAPINTVEDFFEDPQFGALDMLTTLNSKAGEVQIQTPPWQMSETPCEAELPPPALGEHSIQILQENGFSEDEIGSLLREEVIEGDE